MGNDIIHFRSERARHAELLGREDLVAELDRLLGQDGDSRGWVLVKGGPGMGKSALLAHYLERMERSEQRVPHHFLRRGVQGWDRPEAVARNLAAQVEALFPEQTRPDARPESRLQEHLQRVSDEVLVPRGERLLLLIDGLDEAEPVAGGLNPLPHFLPEVLPQRVRVLCASRPTYPYLSWLEAKDRVRRIDLDDDRWAASNEQVVRRYWEQAAPRFEPPLAPALVAEAVRHARGNILYTLKLFDWLQQQPPERRRAELLPRGLEAFLDQVWQQLVALPEYERTVAFTGLGLIAAAREALPHSVLATIAGWREVETGERFLRATRPFLLEEPEHWGGERAWRPFHESFREFIARKLGVEGMRREHSRLAEHLCAWPVEAVGNDFRRRYALQHGVVHWLESRDWQRVRSLCTDLGYLETKCREAGVTATEEDLARAAGVARGDDQDLLRALRRAVQTGSHWVRRNPAALAQLVYNWLRSSGWTEDQLEEALRFPEGLPTFRLRHPVRLSGNEIRTLQGHSDGVNACAVLPDGRRALSSSSDGTLKLWDLETGRTLATLESHSNWVTACAVLPDGRHALSDANNGMLKLWDLETGHTLATLDRHSGGVNACTVLPDGRRALSASNDHTLKLWDLETGRLLATLEGHSGGVNACAVLPDGRRALCAYLDGTLKLWDLETVCPLATLEGHSDRVNACAVLPDGQRALSASSDGTLKLWDLETGRTLATLEGHSGWVMACMVLPDGRRALSASNDRTLKLWDLHSGECLRTLYGSAAFESVAHAGEVICAGDALGNVWILEANPKKPRAKPSTSGTTMDLGIVIALKEEFRVFQELLPSGLRAERDEKTGQYDYTFEFPRSPHRCVVSFIGEMNPEPAALHTERLISRWNPRTVVMLGIAAGLHPDVRVGDVVIASQVDNYLASARAQPGAASGSHEFSLGGTVFQGDHDFLSRVRNLEFAEREAFLSWSRLCQESLAKHVPEQARNELVRQRLIRAEPDLLDVHLASGPVVGAAQEFTRWLREKLDRNLKALDMESAGIMASAFKRVEPTRTLVIRGISDYGDERKSTLDALGEGALRRQAMHNATTLLWTLLRSGVLPRARD